MSLSAIERFRVRKMVAQEVEVRFLPPSLYRNYIEQDFGQDSKLEAKDLTEEQKIDAENRLHELTFKFTRMSETDFRGFTLAFGTTAHKDLITLVESKLAGHFISATHEPKDGSEPIKFTKQDFKEFLGYLDFLELFGLAGDYNKAMKTAVELAVKNDHTPAKDGGPQLDSGLQ